jgi:hypothetical protein
VLVAQALIDLGSTAHRDPWVDPEHVAAAAILVAGFLGDRALAMAARSARLPHRGLHVA